MKLAIVIAGLTSCAFKGHGIDIPADSVSSESTPVDGPIASDAPPDVAIDAPTLAVCPVAPNGCTRFQCAVTSCLYICEDKRTWSSARDRCVSLGLGCLATIDDQAEDTCIATTTLPVFASQTYVWFGFVQAAAGAEPAGGWGWQCGASTFQAGNWGDPTGEPNNVGGNEDCGLVIEGGAWIDGSCATSARYLCEFQR